MNKALWLLIVLVFFPYSMMGQYSDPPPPAEPLSYTFSQFGNETWSFVKQPGNWDAGDVLRMGLIAGGAYLIMETADQPIRDLAQRNQASAKNIPMEFGRLWGDLSAPVVLFTGFAVHSLLTGDPKTRKIGYEIGQASLYAGAVAFIMKSVIGRGRPYLNEGTTSFHPFSSIFNDDYKSLPGGHTTAGFVLSTVLSRNVEPTWLKIVAYIPAALTFISRIYQDKHWTSDDFTGAALGYFIATWVVDQHEMSSTTVGMSSTLPLSITITF
ncbi:MAG: phosphatase PAP2 family protein [Bacteroidetes bacterium]|nr:phosphatase PAP2 family protein [Bacteroidota bacterium]